MLAFDLAVIERDLLALDRASARTFDADGRMHVADCAISKANVCPYYGREIPNAKALGLDPNRVYMLYRDPEELRLAADSFRNLQLLMVHTRVSAKDPKSEVTVGTVGEVAFDGKYLRSKNLTVWDADGIKLIESEEASELSSSYRYRADMTPGRSPEGVAYDGIMRDIKGNHVALVRAGRAGSDVAVNDALPLELSNMPLKRPNLLARLMALGVFPAGTYGEAEKLALDASLAAMTAKDSEHEEEEDMEDDPENPGKRRKRTAAGKPGKTRDGKDKPGLEAMDEAAVDAAISARGFISKDEAQKMANDAATSATAAAVASVNALHEAREAVKPLVGLVAMDSAEAVYRFALEKEGIALDGVHASAFPALVRERIARKAEPAKKSTALETSGLVASALPGLGRFTAG